MSYATLPDLIARAGLVEILQIADRDGDGAPDDDAVLAALTHADNTVNGYVGARYTLPLASTPDLVRTWAVSLARYYLHRDGAPDHVDADHKDAIAALKDVARGLIALPVAAGSPEPEPATGRVLASHPDQVFTADRLRGWS